MKYSVTLVYEYLFAVEYINISKKFLENNLVSEMDLNSIRAFLTRIILLLQFLQFSTLLGRRRICCSFIKLSSKVCSNTKLQQAFIS